MSCLCWVERAQLMVLPEVLFCLKVSESSVPPLERHTWLLSPVPSLNKNKFETLVPSMTEGPTAHRMEGRSSQGQGFQATFQPGMTGKLHSDLKRMETEWSVTRDQEMSNVCTRGLGKARVSCS